MHKLLHICGVVAEVVVAVTVTKQVATVPVVDLL
jgi:hypothetical protein